MSGTSFTRQFRPESLISVGCGGAFNALTVPYFFLLRRFSTDPNVMRRKQSERPISGIRK
jgi:hypothetical protein